MSQTQDIQTKGRAALDFAKRRPLVAAAVGGGALLMLSLIFGRERSDVIAPPGGVPTSATTRPPLGAPASSPSPPAPNPPTPATQPGQTAPPAGQPLRPAIPLPEGLNREPSGVVGVGADQRGGGPVGALRIDQVEIPSPADDNGFARRVGPRETR